MKVNPSKAFSVPLILITAQLIYSIITQRYNSESKYWNIFLSSVIAYEQLIYANERTGMLISAVTLQSLNGLS